MSIIAVSITRKTFEKIFKNLSSKMGAPIQEIQLGIYSQSGTHYYEAYRKFKKELDKITLDNYMGNSIIDFSGGTEVINATIGQAMQKYAKENECPADELNIIMQYKEGELPLAVLLRNGKKLRNIKIKEEFFS